MRNILASLCWILLLAAVRAYGETAVWSDGFETNAASRWQSTGVWHISSPTAGPAINTAGYRTHSGTNCASTLGYPLSQDGRLICTNYNGANSLLVPPTNQYPRLRFWHWFNFDNALGYVEISTNYGANWTQISPTYLNLNGGGVWSRPSFDLSAYAGQNVQIAFHFTSGCCVGNGLGWYVDDVEVDTGTPFLNFPEGFESDPKTSEWTMDFGTWEIGKPTSGPGAAHTGTNCAATVLAGNYTYNVDTRLISPPFIVPSGNPSLHFWQWYSFANALGFVEVNNGITNSTSSSNTTITTNTTTSLNTNIYQLFGALDAGYSTPFYWNPTIGGWTNATKAMGSAFDYGSGRYYFESGNAPLSAVGGANVVEYRVNSVLPSPQSLHPTNFSVWQGVTWNSQSDAYDNPVGYFGTNYTYTYTTNTITTTSGSSWTQISPRYIDANSGIWTNTVLDLSTFAGQTVQIAFHFTSGGCCGISSGWYVDDVTVLPLPSLVLSNATNLSSTNGSRSFKFSVDSFWANSAWVVLASTNLSGAPTNWQPIYTNQGGSSGFTDQLSTNFLQRYYRAVFP